MLNRTSATPSPTTDQPATTHMACRAAHVILAIAMVAAVLIGTSEFDARDMAADLIATQDVQGTLTLE